MDQSQPTQYATPPALPPSISAAEMVAIEGEAKSRVRSFTGVMAAFVGGLAGLAAGGIWAGVSKTRVWSKTIGTTAVAAIAGFFISNLTWGKQPDPAQLQGSKLADELESAPVAAPSSPPTSPHHAARVEAERTQPVQGTPIGRA